jgi:hypothetical protein
MSREQNVPLLLWISTAILAHIATGGGADQVARFIEDRSELQSFARGIRGKLQPSPVIEIGFEAVPASPTIEPPPVLPQSKDAIAEKKAEKKPDAPKPKAAEKKVEPKKIALPAMVAPTPPPPQQPPPTDKRIAVKQHSAPDQDDNPTAKFIADEANHVKEESVAQITAHDRDETNPTPGGHHAGAPDRPGNAEQTKVGDSEDHAGDPTHAPGETASTADTAHTQKGTATQTHGDANKNPAPGLEPNPKFAGTRAPAPPAPPALPSAPGGGGPASPEAIALENGLYRLDPGRAGADGAAGKPGDGQKHLPKPVPNSVLGMLGLGGTPTPGGINLNLTPEAVVAVVGQDKLTKERMADGERRRSTHRGSWQNSSFERWRAAIENYVSSVKPGNQTSLNAARSPFGTYLVTIHNRIHPIFAEDFLGSLDGLPGNHPLNDPTLITRLEIVLDRDDGHVIKMGVVRTSGITAFDIAALDAVQRSSPFGKPPKAIVSPDGNVYFHWEFHRDPVFACSTINARPFMLTTPPPSEPTTPKPTAPPFPGGDPREQGTRHGSLNLPPKGGTYASRDED